MTPTDATQTLYAYTDIATAGTITFLEKYQALLSTGTLMVGGDDGAPFSRAASPTFPTRTEDDVVFESTSPSFAGTYDGVEGEFDCDDACTVGADDGSGALMLTADGVFNFIPNDTGSTIDHGDGDYLYFAYWLHKPDSPGVPHGFGLVYGGNDMFDVSEETPDADERPPCARQ